jgi:hypothetical protein
LLADKRLLLPKEDNKGECLSSFDIITKQSNFTIFCFIIKSMKDSLLWGGGDEMFFENQPETEQSRQRFHD